MKKLILLLLLWPSLAFAADPGCRRSPALTGQCHVVKGTLGLRRDARGVTLESEDGGITRVRPPPGSDADIAPKVMQNWEYWQGQANDMSVRMQGEYQLCPLPPDNGFETGCIADGNKLRAAQ